MKDNKILLLTIKTILVLSFMFILSSNLYAVNMQFLRYSPVAEFTPDDFAMLQKSGFSALNDNADGKTNSWTNPETNHSGTITPLDSSTIDGMQCRKTKITNQTETNNGEVVFTFCKVKDDWKVLK